MDRYRMQPNKSALHWNESITVLIKPTECIVNGMFRTGWTFSKSKPEFPMFY